MAKVIEFYIPNKFHKQCGNGIPPEQRGKVIPFFPHRRRNQQEMKGWAQPHYPADPLLRKAIWERQGTEEFEHNFL